MGRESHIKLSYTLKGFILLYVAAVLEVTKNRSEMVLTTFIGGLIVSLIFDSFLIYVGIVSVVFIIFLSLVIIIYKHIMEDQTKKVKFDAAVEKTLTSFHELSHIL